MKQLLTAILVMVTGATAAFAVGQGVPVIIPAPEQMELREGAFRLTLKTRIMVDKASRDTGEYLAAQLRQSTGYKFSMSTLGSGAGAGAIRLTTMGANTNLGAEGYELEVSSNSVVIRALEQGGMFYGVQTLLQLLPSGILSTDRVTGLDWQMSCVQIEDRPRFKWRGLMLDVSRHFFTKTEVERLLDLMASQKLNTFHWHLVDDQGWRIEIKKYPKLTEIGAWRTNSSLIRPQHGKPPVTAHPAWAEPTAFGPDGRYGGFYTQDDIREVVAYAAARHITVIPEIEMPGHSVAALSAYPQFSCVGGPFSTDVGAGVHHGIYCAGNDQSFEFIQDVLTEVFALFPAQYIHIGGDEVQKDTWKKCPRCQARIQAEGLKNEEELQSYFIRRIEKFVNAHGKTMIGWSEILQGGLAQNAVVMDWIGGGKEAASSGHDTVMTPMSHCYFDHYQSLDWSLEPRAIGDYLPVKTICAFEPVPDGLDARQAAHVLGAQANVWTEYIASSQHLDYMIFPRLCALAEAVWSPKDTRDEMGFQRRLAVENARLEQMGVNYRHDLAVQLGGWSPAQVSAKTAALAWDVTGRIAGAGQYHVTLEYSRGNHGLNIVSAALLEDGREIARDAHPGFAGAEPRDPVYILDLPALKPGAKYTLQADAAGAGGTDSSGTVSWVFVADDTKGRHE